MSCGSKKYRRGRFSRFALTFRRQRLTALLKDADTSISADGRGRWLDNVLIERLWRFLKKQCVYLHAVEARSGLKVGLTRGID